MSNLISRAPTTVVMSATASARAVAACAPMSVAIVAAIVAPHADVPAIVYTARTVAVTARMPALQRKIAVTTLVHSDRWPCSSRPTTAAPSKRGERSDDGETVLAGQAHAEDDDASRHVAGEHAVEPEIPDGVHQTRHEGQHHHQPESYLGTSGVGELRPALAHLRGYQSRVVRHDGGTVRTWVGCGR